MFNFSRLFRKSHIYKYITLICFSNFIINCDSGYWDGTDSKDTGTGTGVSTSISGIAFKNGANAYGFDVRENSYDAYISIRKSTLEETFKTGFKVVVTNHTYGAMAKSDSYTNIDGGNINLYDGENSVQFYCDDRVENLTMPIYGCAFSSQEKDCYSNENQINIIIRDEKELPRLNFYRCYKISFASKATFMGKIQQVVKQAVCTIVDVSMFDSPVTAKPWDTNGDGTLTINGLTNELPDIAQWAKDLGYWDDKYPGMIIIDQPIDGPGLYCRGVSTGNFAVIGSDASVDNAVHELLHMTSYGDLSDIDDDDYVDNIMYHLEGTGLNLAYRSINTYNGPEQQWKELNP